ncbi:MAG: hypothetical protein PHH13_00925 [Candidatus Peribacteraceae bacterium]|nr:hypothetical protein [Candidatus Peribacteraceae bacterium]
MTTTLSSPEHAVPAAEAAAQQRPRTHVPLRLAIKTVYESEEGDVSLLGLVPQSIDAAAQSIRGRVNSSRTEALRLLASAMGNGVIVDPEEYADHYHDFATKLAARCARGQFTCCVREQLNVDPEDPDAVYGALMELSDGQRRLAMNIITTELFVSHPYPCSDVRLT